MEEVWDRLSDLRLRAPPDDGRRLAAVLVPLYTDAEGTVRMILTKRHAGMPTHAGDLAFPGGMAEEAEGPLEAALREAWEEVRIPPEAVEVLGSLEPVATASAALWVVPVVGRLSGRPDLRPDPAEVERVLEPPLAEFLEEERWWTEDWRGHQLWFIEVEEEVLWGATARMVRQLVELLRG